MLEREPPRIARGSFLAPSVKWLFTKNEVKANVIIFYYDCNNF